LRASLRLWRVWLRRLQLWLLHFVGSLHPALLDPGIFRLR
jgi:hypothetical protein